MDNHTHHPYLAAFMLIVSILGTIYAWINILALKDAIGIVAGVISALAGFMAIRYYYYATKKIKKGG